MTPSDAQPGRLNPSPLAFGAFALTTFLLSLVNAGVVGLGFMPVVIATAWFYGGIVQFVVALWQFHERQLFPGVVFGTYGSFWVTFAILQTFYADKVPSAMAGAANAWFLAVWCIVTVYFLVAAFRTNVALVIAFILVEVTLLPLVAGFATGNDALLRLGGYAGLALAVEVWYIAAAEVLNHMYGRVLLPLGSLAAQP